MAKQASVLFPFNGHYFTLEGFAKELEQVIAGAKSYENNTAQPVDRKVLKDLFKQLSDHLKEKSEQ